MAVLEIENTAAQREAWRRADPDQRAAWQLQLLNRLLERILPENAFYRQRLGTDRLQLGSLEELASLPLVRKDELLPVAEDCGGRATFHTFAPERYVRVHRTSGTRGRPLPVMDTAEDWQWWIDTWQYVLDAAEVEPSDRALMAFSFGPFIGFWSANDALVARGAMVLPAGGMSSAARLHFAHELGATVLCCTPTYALHLAEVARSEGIDTAGSAIRRVIVAGEPGGSMAAVRRRIEDAWGARLVDHSGATEVGPWGVGSRDGRGLHVIESAFIAEFLRPEDQQPAGDGEVAELVLTGLGRVGAPAIRYRTGDLVRPRRDAQEDCRFVWLEGGVLGRTDDMLVVRGVNVFPTSIEAILREFPEVGEFRMIARRRGQMDDLQLEVEDRAGRPERIADALQLRLGLRIDVQAVAEGTLPRFEGKARRLVDQR